MRLSQSRVRGFEQAGCPRKWYGEATGELERYSTMPQRYGQYFEYLGLGGGSGYQANQTDLPRLKDGSKGAVQLRIEQQAKRFKRMIDPNDSLFVGHYVSHKQLYLESGGREGTLDFVTVDDVVNDLKLTADLDSDWSYWSDPKSMDHLQAATYVDIYSRKVAFTRDFRYWVFDYSPKMNAAIIDVTVSEEAIVKAQERFEKVDCLINSYDEFPRIPNPNDCRYCRLQCDVRINKANYLYQHITI